MLIPQRDDEIAMLAYDSQIESAFEEESGWHVNLMPEFALSGLPADWPKRQTRKTYHLLTIIVPSAGDLLVPKLARGEPRDLAHASWAQSIGLC
jgi:hypothetical protein